MRMTRHNGRAGKNGVYNPKHNDRRFDIGNSEHIDPEQSKLNIYWDIFNGYRTFDHMEPETELADTFEDVEQLYEYRHHPISDYLNALQWDGQERVRFALHHFLGAEVNDYNYEALRLFMLGAVSRVFKPGTKFEVMFCLVGGQGCWSSGGRPLAPTGAERRPGSPRSSGSWQSKTNGSLTICAAWRMIMFTASCRDTGLWKCQR